MVRTGAYAYAKYGWEDDDSPNVFGGTATQIANSFGAKTAITGWTLTTNRVNLGKLGQVEPASYAYGQQAGTLGVGFVFSDTTSHEIFRNFYGAGVGAGNMDLAIGTSVGCLIGMVAIPIFVVLGKLRRLYKR